MKPEDSKAEFEQQLLGGATRLTDLVPRVGIQAMLRFFESVVTDGCDSAEDGDMLLFQWGTYDWGAGEHFSLNITRQFIAEDGEDEDIWQLRLTFEWPASDGRAFGAGTRWCHDPSELPAFRAFIDDTAVHRALADARAAAVTLEYECAG